MCGTGAAPRGGYGFLRVCFQTLVVNVSKHHCFVSGFLLCPLRVALPPEERCEERLPNASHLEAAEAASENCQICLTLSPILPAVSQAYTFICLSPLV